MLVLVSFGLVLLATILLVVGLLNDDGLTLIYLSIAASAAAAVVLYVAFRKAKPQAGSDTTAAPAPLADEIAPTPVDETAAVPVVEAEASPAPAPAPQPEPEPAPAPAIDADEDWMADADWEDEGVVDFPIADYDDLTVAEIMPLLPQLYSDEIDDVIAREQSGKNRSTIVQRLEELKQTGTEADAAEAAAEAEASSETAAPAPAPAPAAAPATSLLDDDEDDAYFFPIADYDALSVSQITPLLPQLEADELEEVREREVSGAGRKTILNEIDRLLGGAPEPAPAPAKKAARKAPAKKAARRTTTKKATKKAAGKKAATKKSATQKKATKKKSATKAKKAAKKKAAPRFPIANYDELTVADIRPRLTDLSDRQLEQVREREESGAGRKTILKDIDNRLS